MKTHSKSKSLSGFTLVELLVVIAIIAVLAAAGFAGGRAALEKAKKVTAQAAATSVASAIEQFYADNSALPGTGSADVDNLSTLPGGTGVGVLQALIGKDLTQNPRGVRYLSLQEAKGTAEPRGGATYDGSGNILGLYDPWGEAYFIAVDYDYDEQLPVNPGITGTSTTLNGKRSAVYSKGVADGDTPRANTLVKTW